MYEFYVSCTLCVYKFFVRLNPMYEFQRKNHGIPMSKNDASVSNDGRQNHPSKSTRPKPRRQKIQVHKKEVDATIC